MCRYFLTPNKGKSWSRQGVLDTHKHKKKIRKRLTTTHTVTLYDQASHLSTIFLACFLLSGRVSG